MLFPGFSGVIATLGIAIVVGTVVAIKSRMYQGFVFEPPNRPGAFEPVLARYLRLAEFTIGLATGSIVLLVGSATLRGNTGRLPWYYASPLLLLAGSVLFGVAFMLWIQFWYEQFQYGVPYHRYAYCATKTLGFSSAACFCLGYIWLIFVVTRG